MENIHREEKNKNRAVEVVYMRIKNELNKLEDKEKAKILSKFFKTEKGQYGYGDKFIGVTVPDERKIAKKYSSASLKDIQELLESKIHEHRATGLIILTYMYPRNKKEIYDFYLKNIKYVNNWDLVDVTANKIIGDYLLDKDISLLKKLSLSDNIWERRIAIVSTFAFIRERRLKETIEISENLLKDNHDLIQKAVGWMLREVGKKDVKTLEDFLNKHKKEMPRTMLRYAIEHFSKEKQKYYLN